MLSKMYIGLHVKCRLFLSDSNETGIFWTEFSKNPQISNFMKVRPVGVHRIGRHVSAFFTQAVIVGKT